MEIISAEIKGRLETELEKSVKGMKVSERVKYLERLSDYILTLDSTFSTYNQ